MASLGISELFEDNRLPCGLAILPIIVYFPLGILLALVRFFIGLHAFLVSILLPKSLPIRRWILRIMCAVIGITVSVEGLEKRNKCAKVLISNHVSPFDHMAVNFVLPSIVPSVWDIPDGLAWAMGFTEMGVRQGRESLIRNVSKHCEGSDLPVLAYPEGASTSGKVGLLKFSTWPFMLDQPIQPIALRVSRSSLFQVSVSPLGSRWWTDLFWILFTPYTMFSMKLLPAVTKSEDETVEAFTKRVQEVMSLELNVQATPHSDVDKVEHAKRRIFEQTQSTGAGSRPGSSVKPSNVSGQPMEPVILMDKQTRLMVKQVKDVLPHVPTAVILDNLKKTKNVDTTIANIVEGKVEFAPEDPNTYSCPNSSLVHAKFAAQKFGKSSSERQMSFGERKQAMIETARRKFIEKHALL